MKSALVTASVIMGFISYIRYSGYAFYLWLAFGLIASIFLVKSLVRYFGADGTYLNDSGYVVRSGSNELEHRSLAKERLGRELQSNEVVHHINGRKTDNRIMNLCLMDREQHEHSHSRLSWKKNKSGRYPSFREQYRILEERYGGTLLTNVKAPVVAALLTKPNPIVPRKRDPDSNRRLFIELRNERLRIAGERKLRAYQIFHDRTLNEMSERMPDSKHAMFEVSGMSPQKYEEYGAQFIAVVRKFKNGST